MDVEVAIDTGRHSHLTHRDHTTRAIRSAGDAHHEIDGGAELLADRSQRECDITHQHEGLESAQCVGGTVGMTGGQRPFMAGVHGLQHVDRLA
jgi:hypothetical protein